MPIMQSMECFGERAVYWKGGRSCQTGAMKTRFCAADQLKGRGNDHKYLHRPVFRLPGMR